MFFQIVAFGYTPNVTGAREVLAKGALELSGLMAGPCKVFWISSVSNILQDEKTVAVNTFNSNAAVAVKTQTLGTIYSGTNLTMIDGVNSDIVRFDKRMNPVQEKEMFIFSESKYLPAINDPVSIFRTIFS